MPLTKRSIYEKPTKTQTEEISKISIKVIRDKYIDFTIPLTGYREARIIMPKVFTPAEAETFNS